MNGRHRRNTLWTVIAAALLLAACAPQTDSAVCESSAVQSTQAQSAAAGSVSAESAEAVPSAAVAASAAERFLDPVADGATSRSVISLEGMQEGVTLTHVSSSIGVSLDYDAVRFSYEKAAKDAPTIAFRAISPDGAEPAAYLTIARTELTQAQFLADTGWQAQADECDTFTQQLDNETAQCRSYNTGTEPASPGVVEYYVSHDGRSYLIRRVCTMEAEEGYGARMEQLLDSLHFLAKKV